MGSDKRKITSKDVAREAGVSQTLVSFVLNNAQDKKINPATREKVIETARRLGYRVNINARNMRTSKAEAIGFLSEWDLTSFAAAPVLKGIQNVLGGLNLSLIMFSNSQDDKLLFKEYYLQNRIDGLIYLSYVGIGENEVIKTLKKLDIPFMCVFGAQDIEGVSSIDIDYEKSGYIAAEYLIERGYKKIVYLVKDWEDRLNCAELDRIKGCERAAKDLGGASGVEFIRYYGFVGADNKDGYYKAAARLLDEMKFDAVVSTSFECYSVIREANIRGIRLPDAFGVISLDNERYAPYVFPPLTSVCQPFERFGEIAAEALVKKISGDTDRIESVEMEPFIIKRGSVK